MFTKKDGTQASLGAIWEGTDKGGTFGSGLSEEDFNKLAREEQDKLVEKAQSSGVKKDGSLEHTPLDDKLPWEK